MVRAKAMVLVLEVSTAARCGFKINEKEFKKFDDQKSRKYERIGKRAARAAHAVRGASRMFSIPLPLRPPSHDSKPKNRLKVSKQSKIVEK